MSGRSSAVLLKRVQAVAARDHDDAIELAEALSDLRASPKPPGGERLTLNELASHTKRSKRAVCYLLKVWRTFSDLDIPRERLGNIGWTKLAVIAENCDPDRLTFATMITAAKIAFRNSGGGSIAGRPLSRA
jgi:hypothetical protein